eukprot:Awhi_evm1s1100
MRQSMSTTGNKLVPIITKKASPPGGHYSQAMTCKGLAYVSGLLPFTAEGKRLNDASFSDQVQAVLTNLKGILEEVSCNAQNIVSCRVYITDIDNWGTFNDLYN